MLQRRSRVLDEIISEGSDSLEDDQQLIREFLDYSHGYFANTPRTSNLKKGVFDRNALIHMNRRKTTKSSPKVT